jgi:hypothetical protein
MSRINTKKLRAPIVPARLRRICGQSFAFIPHRFLRENFLLSLDRHELALYVFLVLAANKNGVSFYGYDAICSILKMPLEQYIEARNGLIDKDLIAFDGTRFQVLSLPKKTNTVYPKPLTTPADFEKHDRATLNEQFERYEDND